MDCDLFFSCFLWKRILCKMTIVRCVRWHSYIRHKINNLSDSVIQCPLLIDSRVPFLFVFHMFMLRHWNTVCLEEEAVQQNSADGDRKDEKPNNKSFFCSLPNQAPTVPLAFSSSLWWMQTRIEDLSVVSVLLSPFLFLSHTQNHRNTEKKR